MPLLLVPLLPPVEAALSPPVPVDDPPVPEADPLALLDAPVAPEPHAGRESTTPNAATTMGPSEEREILIMAMRERTRSTRRAITGKSRPP